MARSRNIKPGFFKNEDLAECEPLARLLFAGLWTVADREGRFEYRPKKLKIELLPYDDCDIEKLIGQLEAHGFVHLYEAEGRTIGYLPTFSSHQTPHHKEEPSKLPPPKDFDSRSKHDSSMAQACVKQNASCPTDSLNLIPDSLNSDSLLASDDATRPQEPSADEAQAKKRFTPPTVDEVRAYCTERKNRVDAERFVDFYASKNWMIGKNKMADWKAAIRHWEKSDQGNGRAPPPKPPTTAPVPARIPKVNYQ